MRVYSLILALLLLVAFALPVEAADPEQGVRNGWFYGQAGGSDGRGYAITNDGGVMFWRDFQRLGGVRTLGYPASTRFVGSDGFVYQATQGALLQWRPDQERTVLANTMDILSDAGRDAALRTAKGIPVSIGDDGSAGDATRSAAIRMAWLEDTGIREYFLANPNPAAIGDWSQKGALDLYGFPTSRPERIGPFVVQRFQRVTLQRWIDAIPGMPPPGAVTRVLAGDLLKEQALVIPPDATTGTRGDDPAARIDPPLRDALAALRAAPSGQPLVAVSDASPLGIAWAPLPRDVGAMYSARRNWIAVSTRWRGADRRSLATILAHELSHLNDTINQRLVGNEAGCLETEESAFRIQAEVWREFHGPSGRRGQLDELDRQLNFILSSRISDPAGFASRIARLYQKECSEFSP